MLTGGEVKKRPTVNVKKPSTERELRDKKKCRRKKKNRAPSVVLAGSGKKKKRGTRKKNEG